LPGPKARTTAFNLDGEFDNACDVSLTETGAASDEAASWHLRFESLERITGTRTSSSAGGAAAISLHVIPEIDCSGRGGWRVFNSSHLPLVFDYPTAWRLEESGAHDYLVLQCPDPASVNAGGDQIEVSWGKGGEQLRAEDGTTVTSIGPFISYRPDEWLTGIGCDSFRTSCQPVRTGTRRGMKVLQSTAGDYSRYRPAGGKLTAAGDGVDYLFLVGERWLRIWSTNPPPDAAYDGSQPGALVLSGGRGVTERLVLSVKRRQQ